jgi:large subunit ribosomal protein L40
MNSFSNSCSMAARASRLIPQIAHLPAAGAPFPSTTIPLASTPRGFHSTPIVEKKSARPMGDEAVNKAKNFKRTVYGPPPAPLRMARNRALRHWTIHRAWRLFQRNQREAREKELYRMYQSMHNACEELRLTEGPGTREEGYLYRVAMEKKGVYGHNGVPIEYARYQTETPARIPWDHDWTR